MISKTAAAHALDRITRITPIICGCVRSGMGVVSSTDQPVLVPAGEKLASLGEAGEFGT